jgi:hypothetical protein
MAQTVFKFISLPSELLATVGIGNHHMHLLKENLGINYFPPETVAIGTGLINDNGYIEGISFDFGDQGGKQHAMDQLQGWALEHGYQLSNNIHSIYKNAADSWTKQRVPHDFGSAVAFAWIDGKLHLGRSHPTIMEGLTNGEGYDWQDAFNGNAIFGYVFPESQAVEIYSDFYDQNYSEENLKALLAQLRERWTITEVTYGPDEDTLNEMKEFFDDPRQARLAFIDKLLKI